MNHSGTEQNKPQVPSPFSCTFSPNLPELLSQMQCTIVLSTFQAGKVIFISPKNELELVQLPRTFMRPMGIAIDENRMAIATAAEVVYFKSSKDLAKQYPKNPGVYDDIWIPRAQYITGPVDIHDLHFGNNDLWAVNTSFSCLSKIGSEYSFDPVWRPNFISQLTGEDRCHLNGLAMHQGEPKYLSALGHTNEANGWRENIVKGGILIDYNTKEVIAEGLAMPHSPRVYDDKLYVLLSAEEKLVCVDPNTGKQDDVCHIGGFVRGMCRYLDYVFIATSKLRKNSSAFRHLKIADKADVASVTIIHLPTGARVANLTYLASVDEIYDIQILPATTRPNILNTHTDQYKQALMLPNQNYWSQQKKEEDKS